MLRILLLDLGGTLTDGQVVFPHVPEALQALRQFETADGEPLAFGLVSDYDMPGPGASQGEIDAIFGRYVALLDRLDLTRFFAPVERHVTLSTHAGVSKPHRRVFELALERLDVRASLQECGFITENPEHIAGARDLGMQALRFGPAGTPGADFSDWSEAPLLLARLVAPDSDPDLLKALNLRLAVTHRLQVVTIGQRWPDGRVRVRAQRWEPPGPAAGRGGSIHVEVAMEKEIRLTPDGRVAAVEGDELSPEDVAETTHFVETLDANQQIAREPGSLPPGATHQVETNPEGRRVLKRKRFSAI